MEFKKQIKRPYKEEYERLKKLELRTDQIENLFFIKNHDLVPMILVFQEIT